MEKPKKQYEVQMLPITSVKANPDNPRVIKDDKFKKLVKSLQEFPEMMQLRPIVCNSEMMILGGNMRWRTAKEAGWKQIPCIIADNLTPEQQREFIIKDNVSGGDWDWDVLANDWDAIQLEDWGLSIPTYSPEINNMTEDEINTNEEFDPYGIASGFQRVVFIFNGKDEAESYLKANNITYEKRNMAWQVNMTTQSI